MAFFIGFVILWLGACLYALWRGGQPERWVAAILLIAFPLSRWIGMHHYPATSAYPGVLLVDMAIFVAILAIAMAANRFWPLAMAALQAMQVLSHLPKLADPALPSLLYWIGRVGWAYPMLILLVLGTIRHRNRVKACGPEAPWSASWRPFARTRRARRNG